jgi:hypothetical protein
MSLRAQTVLPVDGRFLAAGIAAAAVVSMVTFVVLGPVFGVKSAYVLLGLGLASVMYHWYERPSSLVEVTNSDSPGWVHTKAVLVLALAAVVSVAGARHIGVDPTTVRSGALLVCLPLGYTLVVLGIHRGLVPRAILVQILTLYAVAPVTKVLGTTFYIGKGDTPKHLHYVDLLVEAGTWQAIPTGSLYQYFPGLHSTLGSIRLLAGLSSYAAYMTLGIVLYGVVICLAYLSARMMLGDRTTALFVALATSVLAPIQTHATYLFPQAFVVPLALALLYLVVRQNLTSPDARLAHGSLAATLIVVLWFSHHLTVVLFVPVLLGLLVAPALFARYEPASGATDKVVIRPLALPLMIWVVGSVVYWVIQGVFIGPLVGSIIKVLSKTFIAGGSGIAVPVRALGVPLPEATVWQSLISLGSPSGVYNLVLVCVLALGAVTLLGNINRYRRAGGFVLVGLIGSILLLETPVVANGVRRLRLPFALFVAFPMGIGLQRILGVEVSRLRRLAPAILVLLLLGTSTAVATGHDLGGLRSGPELMENRPLPDGQKTFSASEMRSFERAAAFSRTHKARLSTDWRSEIGLGRYGVEADSIRTGPDHVSAPSEHVLYREAWTAYSLRVIPERLSLRTVVIDQEWMNRFVATENKIYTTGESGILTDHDSGPFLRRS